MAKLVCAALMALLIVSDAGAQSREVLRLASWNLEWLADPAALDRAHFWTRCAARDWDNERLRADLPFCDAYRARKVFTAVDYEKRKLVPLRAGLAALAREHVDVLALQEVGSVAALAAVLPAGYRVACITTRRDAQNVAYAVRIATASAFKCTEIAGLSLEDDPHALRHVRRGLELSVTVGGATLALLNVHLKSGCSRGRMDTGSEACALLQQQVPALERWVESQASHPFLVVGDWNRDLEQELRGHFPARSDGSDPAGPIVPDRVRNLLPEIDDGKPSGSALSLAKVDRSAAASGCFAVLDQLVVSERLVGMLDRTTLDSKRLRARLVAAPPGASDHCALRADLEFRR
jgi:endonuclease/exonuclease/phosphatase family metal-dependent hydrolase